MKRYPGIRPFTAEDVHLFKGRDEEIRDLFQLIVLNDIMVLFGKSGTGKSSLLNAGVCPLLGSRELHPVFIRLNNTNLPPEEQVYELLHEKKYIGSDIPKGLTMWEYFKQFWYVDLGEVYSPVIVFDQFEELFTLYNPQQRKAFIEQFAEIVNGHVPDGLKQKIKSSSPDLDPKIDWETPPKVKFLLSIRSDFLYLLDELSADIPAILRTRFQLQMLNKKNALEAITLPAAMAGNYESPNFSYSDPALTEIIEELGKKETDQLSGDLPESELEIEAFQLQLLCQHLENDIIAKGHPENFTITPEFYGGKEGIKTIIKEFYSGVISRIPPEYQDQVETLLAVNLIRNKRRIIMEESAIITDSNIPKAILDQLHDERMLRKEARTGNFYYEISHDTLVAPVLEKYAVIAQRLEKEAALAREKELAEAKRKIEIEKQKAAEQAKLREAAEANEQRAKQRTRLAAGISFLAVLLAGAAFLFWQNALDATLLAQTEKQNAIDKEKEAIEANKETKKALNLAEIEKLRADSSKLKADTARMEAIENELLAEANALRAEGNLIQANKRFASYLHSEARKAFEVEDIRLAYLLAEEAKKYDKNSDKVNFLLDTLPYYASQYILDGIDYLQSPDSNFISILQKGNDDLKLIVMELGSSSPPLVFDSIQSSYELKNNCQYSPDGKYLSFFRKGNEEEGYELNVIELGNSSPSGRHIFKKIDDNIRNYRYSEDSKYLTFLEKDGYFSKLKILKLGSSSLNPSSLRTYKNCMAKANYHYSPTGKYLTFFTHSDDKKGKGPYLNILELGNSSRYDSFKCSHEHGYEKVYYSKDDKYVLYYTHDYTYRNNYLNHIIKLEGSSAFENHNFGFRNWKTTFSSDGKYLLFFDQEGTLKIGELEGNFPFNERPFSYCRTQSLSKSKYIKNSDGEYLLFFSEGRDKKYNQLNVLDLRSNYSSSSYISIGTCNRENENEDEDKFNFSHSKDGKYLFFYTPEKELKVLKLGDSSISYSYKDCFKAYFSPDSKYLLFYKKEKEKNNLYILKLGGDTVSTPRNLGSVNRPLFSQDIKYLFFHTDEYSLNILELGGDTISNYRVFENYNGNYSSLIQSGNFLFFRTAGDSLNILELGGDSISNHRVFKNEGNVSEKYSFSNEYVFFYSTYGMLNILELGGDTSNPRVFNYSDKARLSPNSKYLIFSQRAPGDKHKLNILELGSSSSFSDRINENHYKYDGYFESESVSFSPNDTYFSFYQRNGDLRVLEFSSSKIRKMKNQYYWKDVSFIANNILLTTSENPLTKRIIYKISDVSLGDREQAFEYYKKHFYKPLTPEEKEKYGIID